MTSKRSLEIKTRILPASVPFIAVLTVLFAFATPAQQGGTWQSSPKSAAASVQVPAGTPAQPSLPLLLLPESANSGGALMMQSPKTKLGDTGVPSTTLFLPVVTYDTGGSEASMVVVADVNSDGKPDLIVLNCGNCYGPPSITHVGSIAVMLGNGDGTFQTAVSYGTGTSSPRFVAVADVNGDGKLDLVVANRCIDNGCLIEAVVAVLLGNGDGTFQRAVTYNSGGLFTSSVAVADVNGDGKPDLVVGNNCADPNCDGSVGVLLGKGDGTFQPAVTYPTGGLYADTVALADLNGDGKLDVVVMTHVPVCKGGTCHYPSAAGVLLGIGDGTFQPVLTYSSGGDSIPPFSSLLTVADVNGDGKPDLIVENSTCCNSANGDVGVLLGNGDGTFQQVATYKSGVGGWGSSVAVADVNGDRKLDVVATDQCASANCNNKGLVAVLLGNGHGTFQAAQTYDAGGFLTNSVAIADLNGDGRPDLVVANICADNASVCAQTSVGVLLNNSSPLKATTTTLTSSLNPSGVRQPVTFTATVSSTSGTPPNGETITFNNGSAILGTSALSGGTASLTTSSLAAGIYTITATYSGDANFAASTSRGLRQVVNSTSKSATATAVTSSLNPSIYGQSVTWTATVTTSGTLQPTGKVNFTWEGGRYSFGTATLNSSGVATLTKSRESADSYQLTAVYSGDANNLGSTSAVRNQVITQATSAATLSSSPNPSIHGRAVTFTATLTSPTVTATGPVTFTVGKTVLGTAQLSGGKAKFTISTLAAGSTTVTATYQGDSNIGGSSASVTQTVLREEIGLLPSPSQPRP